jgi:tRNA/tmRNA/rRNA uracil-C5-methylase (TrmA/RlmC/RlmD family)
VLRAFCLFIRTYSDFEFLFHQPPLFPTVFRVSPAVGEHLTLTITDIAFGGEGVARIEDFVIFVPFVQAGEVVEAEVTEIKKRFARARLVRVVQPSPDRVTPACRYFGDCGGCQYQHIAYASQLQLKQKQICDLFQRIGGFDPAIVAPLVPCPQPYGYRNRIMIRSQWDKFKQGLNIGFIRADNRLVVDIEECPIAEPALNEQIKNVRRHPPPKGGLKVVLRIPPEDWEVPRDSFFQNNFFLLPKLVEVVGQRLREAETKHLVDVYCGVGFFGIELAKLVESFVGVELDRLAIQSARKNALSHGVSNGELVAGAAEELLPGLLQRFTPPATTVLLDPPRKGCPRQMLELLRQIRPAQVIYVSCHPATMARDLNALCADGVFTLAQVTPFDMFPQTQHIETIADLRNSPQISH